MNGVVMGIDPGLNGGLAVLTLEGEHIDSIRMPTIKGKHETIDVRRIKQWMTAYPFTNFRLILMEESGARPIGGEAAERGQSRGSRASNSFIRGIGNIEGAIKVLSYPFDLVTPQRWQRAILGAKPSGLDPAAARAWSKSACIGYVQRRFPTANLFPGKCSKPHDGIADAIGVAEFARRQVVGEN